MLYSWADVIGPSNLTLQDLMDVSVFILEQSPHTQNMSVFCSDESTATNEVLSIKTKICNIQWKQFPKDVLKWLEYEDFIRNLVRYKRLDLCNIGLK